MGLVRERFGEAGVESRRESFYLVVPGWCVQSVDGERIEAEVEYGHLDDVIAALEDLRDNDDQYAKFQEDGGQCDCPDHQEDD